VSTHRGKVAKGCFITVMAWAAGCEVRSPDRPDFLSVRVVPAELELRVGSVDDPIYSLTAFQGMEVHESGRMFTLHRSERLLRMFGSDGSFEGIIGGPGDGPGEFQSPSNMGWVGDTLWVQDTNGYRFSLFSPDGAFYRSFSVPFAMGGDPTEVSPPRAEGILGDGTIWGRPPAFSSQVQAGIFTHHSIVRLTRDGSVIDEVARFPVGRITWGISDPDNPMGGGMYRGQPYADGLLWSLVPGEEAILLLDRTVPDGVSDRGTFRIQKMSFHGDTIFSVSHSLPPIRVGDSVADSLITEVVQALSGSAFFGGLAPSTARRWAEHGLFLPSIHPAVTSMRVGKSGEIWVKESTPSGEEPVWLRLSREGMPIHRVAFPKDLTILQADDQHVWGSEVDDLGIPYLVRYRIPAAW
jgi:hypothetical protein